MNYEQIKKAAYYDELQKIATSRDKLISTGLKASLQTAKTYPAKVPFGSWETTAKKSFNYDRALLRQAATDPVAAGPGDDFLRGTVSELLRKRKQRIGTAAQRKVDIRPQQGTSQVAAKAA